MITAHNALDGNSGAVPDGIPIGESSALIEKSARPMTVHTLA
jgi:hypothetical protein